MKKLFCIFMLCITGIAFLQAQTLSQEDFLEGLKKTHPVFIKEALTSRIETEDRNSLLGTQDWFLYSSIAASRETPELAIAGPERTDALSAEVGVEKVFWQTGSRLSASVSTANASIKIDPFLASMYDIPETFYQNKVALTLTHPLLKNCKGFLDRLQHNLKQFDIDFVEVQAIENQETFLADAALKFIDWVLLTEQVNIISERMKLSIEELERTKRKRTANLVDKVDVIRAEDAVRIAKQNKVLAESHWKALRSELAILAENDQINHLTPDFNLYSQILLPPIDAVKDSIKSDSRILKSIQIRMEQLDLSRRGYQETGKADLSLFAQMNTKNLDEEIAESLDMDKYDVTLGIQFSVPLENRTAKANIEKTDLMIQQLEAQKEELELSLVSAVTNLYIQIDEMTNVLKLNQEQIHSAQQKTEEELKYYNQGRGSLTFVILSRDSEEDAKLLCARNAAVYHQLLIQYQDLMDQIL